MDPSPLRTVEADDRRHDARRGRDEEGGAGDRPVGGVSDPYDLDRDLSGAGHGDIRPSIVSYESRVPILAALLVAMALPFLMPADYSPVARWLLPVVEGALLVAALSVDPGGTDRRSVHIRRLRIAMIGIIVFGAAWATSWLAVDLVRGENVTDSAGELLAAGSLVWIDLIIAFGFLYWELDGGGPGRRARQAPRYPDLAFPQHLNPDVAPPGWRPVFVDYLYLGLTNAFAFSPTDVMPLAHWAKLTMGLESGASLVILGLVIARAVNILA
jgi:hypothetical protein